MFFLTPAQRSVSAAHALRAGVIIAVIGLSAGIAAAAGTIFNSNGFESPYTLAPLQSNPGHPQWVTTGLGPASTATVQNSVVQSGSQAVRVDRASGSSQWWFVPVTGYPTQRFVTIDWDMRVDGPAGVVGAEFGPLFGVDTYDADTGQYVLATFAVDATAGDVVYLDHGTGFITSTGHQIDFGQWNHFRLLLDFANDVFRGYVNGVAVTPVVQFVDDSASNELDNFTDADIFGYAGGPDAGSQNLTGSAFFDNFIIRDGLLGDYDLDGDVDSADYARWRATFGTSISPAGNDADGNKSGVVDAADYVVWRNNLGASLFSGSGTGAGQAVAPAPEPATMALVLAAVLAISTCRHGRS